MNQKKILIFSLAYVPFMGGAEVAIEEITNRISHADFSFDMITLRFDANLPRYEKIGNVHIHRIGFTKWGAMNKYLFPFTACFKAWRLHRKNEYDGIWAMMANYAGFAALFFKIAHPRVPFLLTLQEGDPIGYIKHRVRYVYLLFARIFTKADFVQAISHYLGKFARDMGFTGLLEVVPNGVNTKHFSFAYPQAELDALKQKLGKKNDDRFLITTSRLAKKNAVDDAIKALPLLPESVKFLVLGIGPDEAMLKNLAREIGVEKRVLFLGQITHAQMPKYLHISDMFIRPSLSEGMGNSFVEAMAASVPVIATQEGGIADFLFDPDKNPDKEPTGLAVRPRSPEDIARQTERYLKDTVLAARIVANAKKLVFEKYDWDFIARKMKIIFNTLCGS
ncbi:glycosyltransferase family 4 protein [Candidatus Azambacteria bacterium]|nr:glycosyltransferase family 4 protein [Candidatus Azambacteria bacterium]MBI3685607.1 glycosyltransferase family 4 protein [Candidatus Azambacteria bacterium]